MYQDEILQRVRKYPKLLIYVILLLFIGCQKIDDTCLSYDPTCNLLVAYFIYQIPIKKYYMFVAPVAKNGDLVAAFGGTSGVLAADNGCNANIPISLQGTGVYKAFLVDNDFPNPNRRASQTPNIGDNQIDWVLQPDTEYLRSDGVTTIGTTNSKSLFTFPLDAAVSTSASQYYTGIDTDWTVGLDCGFWTNGVGGNVDTGNSQATDATSLTVGSGGNFCTGSYDLLCVSQ